MANARSPILDGGSPLAHDKAGRLGLRTVSSARSRPGSHVNTVAGRSSSPCLRNVMAGAGCCVAAWIVVYDVSRNDVWSSENTTNADPTDGAPAWSSVLTNHTDGRALSSNAVSVEPLAANFCS